MTKKFRTIIIDGENWAWRFRTAIDDEGYRYGNQTLTIWKDKKIVHEKTYQYYRNRKHYTIRPSLIARFIKSYLNK